MKPSDTNESLSEEFEKSFNKLFPDYVKGQAYDFSHGKVSEADAKRYQEVGDVVEKSLADTETIEISLKTYGFE